MKMHNQRIRRVEDHESFCAFPSPSAQCQQQCSIWLDTWTLNQLQEHVIVITRLKRYLFLRYQSASDSSNPRLHQSSRHVPLVLSISMCKFSRPIEIPYNALHKTRDSNMRATETERDIRHIPEPIMHTSTPSLVGSLNQSRVYFTSLSTLHEPVSWKQEGPCTHCVSYICIYKLFSKAYRISLFSILQS